MVAERPLATALVTSPPFSIMGVLHVAEHARASPLAHPGQTPVRVFAPHESAAKAEAILQACLQSGDLSPYIKELKVVEERPSPTGVNPVKCAYVVLQPGGLPEHGISISVHAAVGPVQPGLPPTEQTHYIEVSYFTEMQRAPPSRKRGRAGDAAHSTAAAAVAGGTEPTTDLPMGGATAATRQPPPPAPARRSLPRQASTKYDPPPFYSSLWGRGGELFNPAGRITDWSRAGYAGGAADIPYYPQLPAFNVRTHGAMANGSDDGPAFQRAIDAAARAAGPGNGIAVFVPPGNYTLLSAVTIGSSYVALRGAGAGRTTLYMPRGLKAIYGNATAWAFGGGFVGIAGSNPGSRKMHPIARVVQIANRGDARLYVSSTAPFRAAANAAAEDEWGIVPPGTLPRVPPGGGISGAAGGRPLPPLLLTAAKYAVAPAYNDGAMASGDSLDAYLYGDNLVNSGTPSAMFPNNDRLRFPFKVTAVGAGWIQIDRPLPINLRLRWSPAIYSYAPTVQHSGIEDLTFQFRWDTYAEHFDDKGYNAIGIYDSANTWARNIHIIDCTSGVFVGGAEFVTVQNISFWVTRPRGTGDMAELGVDGHHALMISHGAYNLLSGFSLPQTRYYHDVSVDALAHLSVVRDGSGLDINLDCHRAATHNNLFTNVDCGRCQRPWQSGGVNNRGAHSAANSTWWGMSSSIPATPPPSLPECTFGPLLNWVGSFDADVQPGACAALRWMVQQAGARQLVPADLFTAQRAHRRLRPV
ncbi:hypothetical protein ABPG75_006054 [Micractinium tetrahymenae]